MTAVPETEREILGELDQTNTSLPENAPHEHDNNIRTPSVASAEEMLIQLRGPRKKPITWSPIEYNKYMLLVPPKNKTPEKVGVRKVRPGLCRRLTLSPEKTFYTTDTSLRTKLKSLKTTTNH